MTDLSYRIHWVDDTPDWVDSVKGPIERDYGAREVALGIITAENGANIEETLNISPVDLVVLDYNLPVETGISLVKKLRTGGNLTEIIFYSQDDTKQSEFADWDGIHSCHRDEASETLCRVIDRFIERTKNISIMRGMIISEAIDCENHLTDIIMDLFGEKSAIFREKILNKAYLDFEKKRMLILSVLNDKVRDLRSSNANECDIFEISACINCIKEMKKEIVDQRNILAHSEKSVGDDGILILRGLKNDGPGIKFDNAWKNDIRQNIAKHISNLRKIRQLLST